MKRIAGTALIALTISSAGITFAHPHGDAGMTGGGMDSGTMCGDVGPGMMGGGMMDGGMMGMNAALSKLPADKQEQVRAVQSSMMKAGASMFEDMKSKSLALSEAMRKFPLDTAAVKKLRDGIEQGRAEMFALHLNAMAQAQQIVGKDAWEQMHQGMAQGAGMMMPPGGHQGR